MKFLILLILGNQCISNKVLIGVACDEGSAYVRLFKQMEIDYTYDSELFDSPEESTTIDMIDSVEIDNEALYNEIEIESTEDAIIINPRQFASEFDTQNTEVVDYFRKLKYDKVVTFNKTNALTDCNQSDIDEEPEYDFSRPDQVENQFCRNVGDNLPRPLSKYFPDLTIQLGNYFSTFVNNFYP